MEPGLRKTTLDNGLTVLSEFIPGVRSVAVGAWVRSASVHEPPSQMGVSHCLEHLVFKGTRSMGPREIALSIEQLGGSLDAYTSRDHTAFQARMLDEHLDEATRVIGELIFHPALRESDLKLEKKVITEEIGSVEDAPDDLVFELHNAALWGGSAFGWPILGTRQTVAALRIADLRSLHERAYRPGLIVVAAAGNVEHERLLESLEKGGWHAAPPGGTLPTMPPLPPEQVGVQQVHGRDGSQVHLVMGSRAIANADARRHAFGLVSMLLGDGMSSRLFQRVREDLGLAYSVSTFADFFVGAGSHGVYLGTAPTRPTRPRPSCARNSRAWPMRAFRPTTSAWPSSSSRGRWCCRWRASAAGCIAPRRPSCMAAHGATWTPCSPKSTPWTSRKCVGCARISSRPSARPWCASGRSISSRETATVPPSPVT